MASLLIVYYRCHHLIIKGPQPLQRHLYFMQQKMAIKRYKVAHCDVTLLSRGYNTYVTINEKLKKYSVLVICDVRNFFKFFKALCHFLKEKFNPKKMI